MKLKLTKLERAWIMYDIGNSAFVLLVATIIPIYFNYLADMKNISSSNYLAYWGYATSVATLIVAVIGPIFGTVADTKNMKKKIFMACLMVGTISCAVLGLITHWLVFLVIFVIAKVGFSSSLVFYDAMLTDVTTEERMDDVSSQGYAWGYIGSCIPFIIGLCLVLFGDKVGLSMQMSMAITFLITAVWWFAITLPLLEQYKQIHYVENQGAILRKSFGRLWNSLKEMKKEKHIFMFLLAFFFYIDGVYTIIDMATAYGESLGLDSTGLLLALLVTQIVAFPFCLIFGILAKKISGSTLITVCIGAYFLIVLYAIQLDKQYEFWILAVCVGMFQGGIQALSRSYFAKIIPPEKSGEYFGLLDICGKGASFLGTTLVSVVSQVTGKVNIGVGAIAVIFVIGFILFRKAVALNPGK
ncbi:MAG: MFS transporter [Oliverpabstia sp.]|nr:MFS transporter [Lachnospiraceae bacterium]MDY5025732.1 MFS transporter [Oliverpabstia sp.]